MDPESKKLLEDTFKLTKENNEMLHKVRNVQKRAFLFNSLYWILIIAIGVGALYFIQPFIDKAQVFLMDAGLNTGISMDQFKNSR